MNRTNILWVGFLGGILLVGCSDPEGGGTGGTGAVDGTAGSGGSAGTGAVGGADGVGGVNGDYGVVNVDIMASVMPMLGGDVYVGDDGVLSSSGATYWNPADPFTSVTNADDELGAPTPIDFVVNASGLIFIGAAQNELQDHGISNRGANATVGFDWQDLAPDGVYDLAVYVYAEARLSAWTTFDVIHADGTTSLGPNDEPSWELPGQPGADYILLDGVRPYEVTSGVYGFRINNINEEGAIQGAQLRRAQ